ncbi:hypothetical protein MBLNU457_7702t1 [Dothideomycetes sp. NU457]
MPSIHHLPLSPSTISTILTFLSPHLPQTLSLYRRLQFGNFSPSAQLLSTFNIDNLSSISDQESNTKWIIAFVDRSRRPETEVFLSCSWESDTSLIHDEITQNEECTALVISLLSALATLPAPLSEPQTQNPSEPAHEENIYTSHLSSPSQILLGAIHSTTAILIRNLHVLAPSSIEKEGLPEAYNRWVFPLHSLPSISGEKFSLPDGLVFGELRECDFGLVRSRTLIPRQESTLRCLARVAVYDRTRSGGRKEEGMNGEEGDEKPVAWAFLGVDGSLSTLHVEEGYRGRGLARAVAVRLWEEEMAVFTRGQGGERWASADVATYNKESNAVCRGLGGEVAYVDYWLRVDLEKVR